MRDCQLQFNWSHSRRMLTTPRPEPYAGDTMEGLRRTLAARAAQGELL
jgi:hypothetical protein